MEIKIYKIMSGGHFSNYEVEKYKNENNASDQEIFMINVEKPSEIAVCFNNEKKEILSLNIWHDRPDYENRKTSYIGNIKIKGGKIKDTAEKEDEKGKGEEIKRAFNKILDIMKDRGTETVIGPLNGTTWNSYRYVVKMENKKIGAYKKEEGKKAGKEYKRPPFLMEPENNPEGARLLENTGFSPLAYYFSTVMEDIGSREKLDKKIEKIKKMGLYTNVKIETAENKDLDDILEKIYYITVNAFKNNFLYTPLEKEIFIKMYKKYEDRLVKKFLRLIYLNEENKEPTGFIFGIPDYGEMTYKGKIETVILKTIGVLPEYHGKGLGYILIDSLVQEAEKDGYRKMICALMHEGNISKNIGL